MVITQNTTLTQDIGPCSADGIIIGADNVTLSLNGHTVFGKNQLKDGIGVRVTGRTGVHVLGPGTVKFFDAGVLIDGGSANEVASLTAEDNVGSGNKTDFGDGIAIADSTGNSIHDNIVRRNGPFSGIGVFELVGDASNNTIDSNTVTDNNLPTVQSSTDHGSVNQDDGIRLEPGTHDNTVTNNTVTGSGLDGIAVFARSTDNLVQGNDVRSNGYHDKLHRKGDGIRVFVTGDRNVVEDNDVFDNAANGIFIGSLNNQILANRTGGNGSTSPTTLFDLRDSNSTCDNNTWSGNTFQTAFPACTQAP